MNALELTQSEIAEWSPLTQAIGKLQDAHFAVFNEMESTSGIRERARLAKALGTIYRAGEHLKPSAPIMLERPTGKVTRFTARDAQGNPFAWAFWYDSGYRAWFLRDCDNYERRMGDNWQDSAPRIKMVLENYGMTAEIS